MDCPQCNSTNTSVFFVENIPCNHCSGTTELIYHSCTNCGMMWKTVDDQIINTSFEAPKALDEFLAEDLSKELEEFLSKSLDELFDGIPVTELRLSDSGTMQDLIHKCIRCGTVSYEIKPRLFHCPDCGFEWEVL